VFQRATVTGGAWGHDPPLMPEMGGSALLSPSLPFPAGCEEHHHLQNTKKRKQQSVFVFILDLFFSGRSFRFWTCNRLPLYGGCPFCRWRIWWLS